jgi:hypothetical protein
MNLARSKSMRSSRGQSLVETALMMPLMIMLLLNIINLAHFFLMAINLTGSARTGALYSILGSATPYASQLPTDASSSANQTVANVAWGDMKALWGQPGSWVPANVTLQVCSPVLGINQTGTGTTSQVPKCDQCTSTGCSSVTGSSISPGLNPDPEAPTFVLNQVSVTYQFNPLIPGQIFNIPLQAFSGICNAGGSCTFTRYAQMRAMN